MAINGEEHTITQLVLALERPADWKAPESFAEYGAWHPDHTDRQPDPVGRRCPRAALARLSYLGRR